MTKQHLRGVTSAALVVGLLTTFTVASAESRISQPKTGTRLEPNEVTTLTWDVDFNNRGIKHSEQFHLYMAPDRDGEFVLIDVINRDDPGMVAIDEADGVWEYQWTVPYVICEECLVRIVEVPGRGDYDNSGQVAVSVGADWVLNGEVQDIGELAAETGGTRDDDPRSGHRELITDGAAADTSTLDSQSPTAGDDVSNSAEADSSPQGGAGQADAESSNGSAGGCSLAPTPLSVGAVWPLAALFAAASFVRRPRRKSR